MKNVMCVRLAMYLAVERELQAIVSSVGTAGLSALLDVLKSKVGEVSELHAIQTETTHPKTKERNDALSEMVAAALVVAGPLGAHAHKQGLHEVEAVADVTLYSLERLRLVERPTAAQKIHDAALPLVVALTPLGVTEATIADLQAKIDAARALLNQPRTTIIDRRRATEGLSELFVATDRLLEKQIDRALAPLAVTHPELHRRYFAAREMPRRGRPAEEPVVAPAAVTTPVTAPPVAKAA